MELGSEDPLVLGGVGGAGAHDPGLAGVAAERDGRAVEQLANPAALVVGQRVHRVDQDRLDRVDAFAVLAQAMVDDRHQERLGLPRAGSGGDDRGLALENPAAGVGLMAIGSLCDRAEAGARLGREHVERRGVLVRLRQGDERLAGQEAVLLDLGMESRGQIWLAGGEGCLEQLEVFGAEVAGDQQGIHEGARKRCQPRIDEIRSSCPEVTGESRPSASRKSSVGRRPIARQHQAKAVLSERHVSGRERTLVTSSCRRMARPCSISSKLLPFPSAEAIALSWFFGWGIVSTSPSKSASSVPSTAFTAAASAK